MRVLKGVLDYDRVFPELQYRVGSDNSVALVVWKDSLLGDRSGELLVLPAGDHEGADHDRCVERKRVALDEQDAELLGQRRCEGVHQVVAGNRRCALGHPTLSLPPMTTMFL